MTIKKKVQVIFLGVGIVAAAFVLFRHFHPDPTSVAEDISGLTLPSGTTLVAQEGRWGEGLISDGFSIWVFAIPSNFEAFAARDCEALKPGYRKRPFSSSVLGLHQRGSIQHLLYPIEEACYLIKEEGGHLEMSLIGDRKLIIFVSAL